LVKAGWIIRSAFFDGWEYQRLAVTVSIAVVGRIVFFNPAFFVIASESACAHEAG
jgi:hypothetical protein